MKRNDDNKCEEATRSKFNVCHLTLIDKLCFIPTIFGSFVTCFVVSMAVGSIALSSRQSSVHCLTRTRIVGHVVRIVNTVRHPLDCVCVCVSVT